ncbi:MAG: antitoxin [Verrucomicrobia bacterium]|nr:antitoxin [Verrucomicrobiota bacterium]
MRTTVTIDADTELLLKQEVRQTGQSFKQVLNRAIRKSLSKGEKKDVKVEPLFTAPFPADLMAGSMNRLADELDDKDTLRELGA